MWAGAMLDSGPAVEAKRMRRPASARTPAAAA